MAGGADTGCQIASVFDDLGARVSLFEAGPVLVPAAEGVSMAAQKICRTLGIGRFPQVWSYLGPDD